MAMYGHAGQCLKVNLSDNSIERLPTADYAGRFLGGKGVAARLYWEAVPSPTAAFSPENCLVCASGPAAGFTGFASSRWLVCGKTAANDPEAFSYGNLGGSWGNRLKSAGYDAIVVQGKADRPVYLWIHDDKVEFRDATHLWGKTSFASYDALKAEHGQMTSVLSIGQAAENLVVFATLLADQGASGSGGTGAIMGSKNLKAIVVAGDKKPVAAFPEKVRSLAELLREISRLPNPDMWWVIPGITRTEACHGCGLGCTRQSYKDGTGRSFKSFCQPIDIYRRQANKYYNGWNDSILLAMRLCDQYGLDSCVMQAMIEWLGKGYKEGLLKEKETGLPLSRIGTPEFIEALTRMITYREGFGTLLAQGTIKAAEAVGKRAAELISYSVMNRSNEVKDYDPRLALQNALCIATEPRRPVQQVHEGSGALIAWLDWQAGRTGPMSLSPEALRENAVRYWGGAAAGDYTSYEGKALAAKRIQDRTYAFESIVLCNARWPMTRNNGNGPELAAKIVSAITGRDLDEVELERTGERIFNIQRAINIVQGWRGRDSDTMLDFYYNEPIQYTRYDRDCKVPGRDGEVRSRKGTVIERKEFEKMKDEYYRLRGWDETSGLQTKAGLEALDLGDIAAGLKKKGLLKQVKTVIARER
jgi:aldehyde:ferredoxin oxidoreductase